MPDSPVVRFHYLKSSAYRVIHVDGIIGGLTPTNLIHFSFYTERPPIPTMVEFKAIDIGGGLMKLGAESGREGKQGVARDVEVGAVMTVDVAKKLRSWLDDKISKAEKDQDEPVADEAAAPNVG